MKLIIKPGHLNLASLLFCLGIFLKQFYTGKSGTLQIGDILLMASFLMLVLRFDVRFQHIDLSILAFVFCTVLVNGFYYFVLKEGSIKPVLYYVYNFVVILTFRNLLRHEEFIESLSKVLKFVLITQMAVFLTGRGRYMPGSTLRYQGTFNDPNQFGFYIICCLFLLYMYSVYSKKKLHFVWYLVSGALIILSSSTGMTLAFSVFLFFAVVLPRFQNKGNVTKILVFALYCICVVLLIVFADVLQYLSSIVQWRNLSYLLRRISSKAEKVSVGNGFYRFLTERQMLCIIQAPEYFLFGLGEGNAVRKLAISGQDNEIHCTMVALWYYYGIIPYAFFLKWIRDNLRDLPGQYSCVIIGLIIEAFTLANHRQPFFWIVFAFASYIAKGSKEVRSQGEELSYIEEEKSIPKLG